MPEAQLQQKMNLPQEKKLIYIVATGCHENFMDAALVRTYFTELNDFQVCDSYKEADIIVILGCSVHQLMEDQTREMIDYINEHKSRNAEVVVAGCISKVRPEFAPRDGIGKAILEDIDELIRFEGKGKEPAVHCAYDGVTPDLAIALSERRKAFFGQYYNRDQSGLMQSLLNPAFSGLYDLMKRYKDFFESRIDVFNDKTYCIKISTGCLGQCSYCSIKQSRGRIKSMPMDNILVGFHQGLAQVFKHFVLLGTDLGDYGRDIGLDLCDLLESLVCINEDFKIKLRNVNPRWLIPNWPRFRTILESGKISYLRSPIQSGNNRILELMKRGYHVEEFSKIAREIHNRFPFIFLTTDIIVGFPTETETEFQDSLEISPIFDYAVVFRYTKRPNTLASLLEPEVPQDVIVRRYRKILLRSLFNNPWRKVQAIYRLNS